MEENGKHAMILKTLKLKEIHDDPEFNCRGKITPIDVVPLAKDIAAKGLIQPITVCLFDDVQQTEKGRPYRLLAGFRRYKAFQINGENEIPCVVKGIMSELEAIAFNLSENLQREDLNILQEANAIRKMKMLGLTETEAGEQIGQSRGWIQVRFMLLGLPEDIQQEAALGGFTQSNIRELYTVFNRTGDIKLVYDAALKLKKAKAQGTSIQLNTTKEKTRSVKKQRKRPEIFAMIEEMMNAFGSGLYSRSLAWSAGQISTEDLYQSMKEYATEHEIQWDIPEV